MLLFWLDDDLVQHTAFSFSFYLLANIYRYNLKYIQYIVNYLQVGSILIVARLLLIALSIFPPRVVFFLIHNTIWDRKNFNRIQVSNTLS